MNVSDKLQQAALRLLDATNHHLGSSANNL